eukprot:TRINITY_DN24763_c0_g1_i1.p1 TRINITY_DN24763_c0_g1~~TRINITY_DN24763_c0_g1_i1.p1  ORF type:complete len:164 (+),score=30.00 TRINITY_DN24763_c0_g1_i1:92-583(+)
MSRPNRSDAHVSIEEEAKIEEETREYFEDLAPKRHTKPQRSEHSSNYTDAIPGSDSETIPELVKFQDLETQAEKMVYNGSEVTEEYVETEYYKDLNGIDKQHHATGTGFIKISNANGSSFNLTPESDVSCCHSSCKGNPATNEWIPAADKVIPTSSKPDRSDT